MDAHTSGGDDQMEVSVTGSTGGTSSVRTGKGAKSSSTRMVASKFMQVPHTGHRHEVSGREAQQFRAGASMGYASLAATPANAMHGRSMNLASNIKASGFVTNRTIGARDPHHLPFASPSAGATSLTAASIAAPFQLSNMFDTAAQERRREELARFKQEKAARAGRASSAAAPTGPSLGSGAAGAPRVPTLALGILRDGAQDGSRSARGAGGVYSSGAVGNGAPVSARGPQMHSARAPGALRPAAGASVAGTAAGRAGGSSAANTAKVPPVPRFPLMPPPGMVEQQLRTAVNAPLPKDELWEAAQVALPADAAEEGTAAPALAKTPSSRITKSPRVVAQGGGGGTWAPTGQSLPMQPPQVPAHGSSHQQSAAVPPRSPPPVSARGMPASAQPSAAGATASDLNGSRLASNAEASVSDTSGRSIRDQIKISRIQLLAATGTQELQWRLLKAKLEVASRAKIEKGQKQLAACALMLTDMMAQSATNSAALEAAEAMKRTQHVLKNLLPLLEQWRELQDTHGPATREVLTALQNAMTSLPLVNGAALGMGGGDGAQALPQLRRALANSLGSLQSAEVALGMLIQGFTARVSGGGAAAGDVRGAQGQPVQGGVTAMATLLPQLHDTLVGEVANLRNLLTNLNALATKLDEAACLRVRTAVAALAASSHEQASANTGPFGEMVIDSTAAATLAAEAAANPDTSNAGQAALMSRALAMLGLGVMEW